MGLFDNAKKDPNAELSQKLETLTQTVQSLQGNIGEITNAVKTLHSNQTQMNTDLNSVRDGNVLGQGNDSQRQDAATEELRNLSSYSEDELSTLTDRERYSIQEQNTQKMLEETVKRALEPVTQNLNSVQSNMVQGQAQSELKELMSEKGSDGKVLRPDFQDQSLLQMMTTMKKDPTMQNLPLRNLYVLAKDKMRSDQPEAYSALEGKYFPKEVKSSYGGIFSDQAPAGEPAGDMTLEEASAAAAQEVLSDGGGLPQGAENAL